MPHRIPRPLLLALGLVLLGHWTGLSWLRAQWPRTGPLTLMGEPLLTRVIAPVEPVTPIEPPRAAPPFPTPKPKRRAAVSATLLARAPTPVETIALPMLAMDDNLPEPLAASAPPKDVPASPLVAPTPAAEVQASDTPAPDPGDTAPPIDTRPPDTRLVYDLKGYYRGDMYGSGRVQWQREQGRYQVRIDLRMALLVHVALTSQGEVTEAGLMPSAYQERAPWGERRVALKDGYVTLHNGSRWPQPQALQDTASQFVELSHRFATGRERLQVGGQVRVWLARPQAMALWTYDVVEQETLDLPELGPVQAFHLRPRPIANPQGAITAELWFAPSLQYLPVRVRTVLGSGNYADLLVHRIEQGAAPVPAPRPNPMWD